MTTSPGGSDLALRYADLARRHAVFAPQESQLRTFGDGVFRRSYELAPTAPPTWAFSLYAGLVLKADSLLRHAVPLPRAIVAHALRSDVDEAERRLAHYAVVERAARELSRMAEEARVADAAIREGCSSLRSSSRAPLLALHLAGLGALRSDQIERALGVSRAGVHGMIANLRATGLVTTTQVSGVKLHALTANTPIGGRVGSTPQTPSAGLSKVALVEFDTAMAALDRLVPPDDARSHCHRPLLRGGFAQE